MSPARATLGILWLAVGATACVPGGDSAPDQSQVGLSVSLSPIYPTRGDSISLKLTNGEAVPIGYNLCTARLLRGASGPGEPVPEDRVCTAELGILPPGGADSIKLGVSDTLTGPSYHYVVSAERQGTGETVEISTGEFRPR